MRPTAFLPPGARTSQPWARRTLPQTQRATRRRRATLTGAMRSNPKYALFCALRSGSYDSLITTQGQRRPKSRNSRQCTAHPMRKALQSYRSPAEDQGQPPPGSLYHWHMSLILARLQIGRPIIQQSRSRILRGQS